MVFKANILSLIYKWNLQSISKAVAWPQTYYSFELNCHPKIKQRLSISLK